MHIPSEMLSTPVCPVSAVVAIVGVATYAVGGVASGLLSGHLAAGIGVLAVLAIGYLLALPVCRKSRA